MKSRSSTLYYVASIFPVVLIEIVSRASILSLLQIIRVFELLCWKIFRFLASYIRHSKVWGRVFHTLFTKLLLFSFQGQHFLHFWIVSTMVCWGSQFKLPVEDIFSQQSTAKGHFMNRWCIVSSSLQQVGHMDGPLMPLLCRFSTVKIFPFNKSHIKNFIFGRASVRQIIFQWFHKLIRKVLLQRYWWPTLTI